MIQPSALTALANYLITTINSQEYLLRSLRENPGWKGAVGDLMQELLPLNPHARAKAPSLGV